MTHDYQNHNLHHRQRIRSKLAPHILKRRCFVLTLFPHMADIGNALCPFPMENISLAVQRTTPGCISALPVGIPPAVFKQEVHFGTIAVPVVAQTRSQSPTSKSSVQLTEHPGFQNSSTHRAALQRCRRWPTAQARTQPGIHEI